LPTYQQFVIQFAIVIITISLCFSY